MEAASSGSDVRMNLVPVRKAGQGRLHGRRLPCQIMLELLRLAGRGEGKTRLMYGANISYALLMRYLAFFEAKKFVLRAGDKYVLTEDGRKFMQDLNKVLKYLEEEEAPPFLM